MSQPQPVQYPDLKHVNRMIRHAVRAQQKSLEPITIAFEVALALRGKFVPVHCVTGNFAEQEGRGVTRVVQLKFGQVVWRAETPASYLYYVRPWPGQRLFLVADVPRSTGA